MSPAPHARLSSETGCLWTALPPPAAPRPHAHASTTPHRRPPLSSLQRSDAADEGAIAWLCGKPADGADIVTLEDAKAEVTRLRRAASIMGATPPAEADVSITVGGQSIKVGSECDLMAIKDEDGNVGGLNKLGLTISAIPDGIFTQLALTSLNVRGNQIGSLPAGIGALVWLTELNVAECGLKALPDEIGNCVRLEACPLMSPAPPAAAPTPPRRACARACFRPSAVGPCYTPSASPRAYRSAASPLRRRCVAASLRHRISLCRERHPAHISRPVAPLQEGGALTLDVAIKALEPQIKQLDGFISLQRFVCGSCNDFKVRLAKRAPSGCTRPPHHAGPARTHATMQPRIWPCTHLDAHGHA